MKHRRGPAWASNCPAGVSEVCEGEIPADLRNLALVASDSAGTVWIALQAEAEVRRYAPDGALEWSSPVVEPEMAAARDTFFSRNLREPNPARFYSLR